MEQLPSRQQRSQAGRIVGAGLAVLMGVALALLNATRCLADSFTVQTALEDTKLYFTAPLLRDQNEVGTPIDLAPVARYTDGGRKLIKDG